MLFSGYISYRLKIKYTIRLVNYWWSYCKTLICLHLKLLKIFSSFKTFVTNEIRWLKRTEISYNGRQRSLHFTCFPSSDDARAKVTTSLIADVHRIESFFCKVGRAHVYLFPVVKACFPNYFELIMFWRKNASHLIFGRTWNSFVLHWFAQFESYACIRKKIRFD